MVRSHPTPTARVFGVTNKQETTAKSGWLNLRASDPAQELGYAVDLVVMPPAGKSEQLNRPRPWQECPTPSAAQFSVWLCSSLDFLTLWMRLLIDPP